MKAGDIVTDADGTEWVIVFVETVMGAPSYSRVKVGSLAAKIHGYA